MGAESKKIAADGQNAHAEATQPLKGAVVRDALGIAGG